VETADTQLADFLRQRGAIRTARVQAAFAAIPRHVFVPHVSASHAYSDRSEWVHRPDGTIATVASQPTAVAASLELLHIEPGQSVLEIGAGTGYNAALLSYLVGPTGQVTTLDIDEDLTHSASAALAVLGLSADRVAVVFADGSYGYPPRAPYDRILLTVGTDDFSAAWWDQLRPGGRLVLPMAIRGSDQFMIAFDSLPDHFESRSVGVADYMWLRGDQAMNLGVAVPFGRADCGVACETAAAYAADYLRSLLERPREAFGTGVQTTRPQFWWRLTRWLALHATAYCNLRTTAPDCARGMVPRYSLDEWGGFAFATIGLLDDSGLALIEPWPEFHPPAPRLDEVTPFALQVRGYGESDLPARRLLDFIRAWDASKRQATEGVRVRAYRHGYLDLANEDGNVVNKSGADLVIDWPQVESH
jgi:protein-L-isoaspartate(D-aspartate) O-methyltransferase